MQDSDKIFGGLDCLLYLRGIKAKFDMTLSDLLNISNQMPLLSIRMQKLKRKVIHLLVHDEKTIVELCKETEFSIPTVTKVISELKEMGIVMEKGKLDTMGGRPPAVYAINPDCAYLMGVDVKRDSVMLAVQNFKNEMVKPAKQVPYQLEDTIESLKELCGIINRFIEESGTEREKILSACVVFTGRINSEEGYNNTFFHFGDRPLTHLIEEEIHIKTFIENDSRAMLYGEYCSGNVGVRKNVIYLNVSWGFGISIICNGELYYGHSGYSGEFGHSPILDNELICDCGKKGCIQTEISGETLVRLFKHRLLEGRTSVLAKRKRIDSITMHDIIEAAVREEDMLAIEAIGQVGEKLGRYLSLLINVFNPDLVIIGGNLAAARPYFELAVRSAVCKYSLNLLLQDMELRSATLGNEAAVVGACHIIQRRLFGGR